MTRWHSELAQFEQPYHSTVAFERFLAGHGCLVPGTRVLDAGTGLGAVPHYLRRKHPDVRFTGVDYNADKIAASLAAGVELEVADWFRLPPPHYGAYDGVISVHAICTCLHIEDGLAPLMALNPGWIAINSLFYDGPLDVLIHIRNHERLASDLSSDGDFNVFSLERTAAAFAEQWYEMISEPFFPPEALPRKPGRGTYTMRTELHEHTQFSGPVHLPWHFVLARRHAA